MNRAAYFSSFLLLALGCARDPGAPPPAGGQSGDDGDVIPDPPGEPTPIPPGIPGIPELPCDPEETELDVGAATAFGASASELVDHLELAATPFFWVPFDALEATTFTPGPSETTLSLGITVSPGATVTQTLWRPRAKASGCPESSVQVPVRVSLQTSDGALDEQVDSVLELTSANTARLTLALERDALVGGFGFEQLGPPEQEWEMTALDIQAEFWPRGSRGRVSPSYSARANLPAIPPPPPGLPNPVAITPGSAIALPELPDGWGSTIAVWPRRETCNGNGIGGADAHAPSDAVIGLSLDDVISELDAHADSTLTAGDEAMPVRFTLQAPAGLQCVHVERNSMTFYAVATLSADEATGSPLEHLAVTNVFEVTAKSAANGAALEELRWVRRDVVAAQTRAAFQASTGLVLDAASEYRQVWWSWHGQGTRQAATAPWALRGELVVNSLNAAQAAEIDRVVSQGGPGAGISFDTDTQFPTLPGDRLLEAEIAP